MRDILILNRILTQDKIHNSVGTLLGLNMKLTGTGGGCCECGDEPSDSCATELVS
jgi:hypothetical protein